MPKKFTAVFLSSTSRDLQPYRDAVVERFQKTEFYHWIRMEDFGARDWQADAFCRSKVAESDLFIGIIGHRYGDCPEGSSQSFTEREFDAAVQSKRPRLIFLASESLALEPDLIESDEKRWQQTTFRKRASRDRIVDWFSSREELVAKVPIAIENWARQPATVAHDVFENHATIIDSSAFENPSPEDEIQRYYSANEPSWNVVASGALVERDQLNPLLEKLRRPDDRLRMICILADPGMGKSSLAYQAAEKVVKLDKKLLVQFPGGGEATPEYTWRRLSELCRRMSESVYVLVDDVFRSDSVVRFLKKELDTSLPVMVLATSRTAEFRAIFKFPIERVNLAAPSENEKRAAAGKLKINWDDLNWYRRSSLRKANSFLVLMYELSHGRGDQDIREIIREMVRDLKREEAEVHEAYEYICFSYQFEVSMPQALVERLVPGWQRHALLGNQAARGLIFQDEKFQSHVRASHPVIAEKTCEVLQLKTEAIYQHLAKAIDSQESEQRLYFLHLSFEIARVLPHVNLPGLIARNQTVIDSLEQQATMRELTLWHKLFSQLKLRPQADRAAELAFASEPADDEDWRGLIMLCLERKSPPGTLEKMTEWLRHRPNEWLFRSIYLNVLAKHAQGEIPAAIDDLHKWLSEHVEDFYVREHYLGQVKKHGSEAQKKRALEQTADWWAAERSSDPRRLVGEAQVGAAYLGLVSDTATNEQASQALSQTHEWLAAHLDDKHVREAYLSLARQRGSPADVQRAIQDTEPWLKERPREKQVRGAFQNLVASQKARQSSSHSR